MISEGDTLTLVVSLYRLKNWSIENKIQRQRAHVYVAAYYTLYLRHRQIPIKYNYILQFDDNKTKLWRVQCNVGKLITIERTLSTMFVKFEQCFKT